MMRKSTFTMACMLLTVGCTGLQTNGNKNESKKKDNFSNNNNGNREQRNYEEFQVFDLFN